MPKENEVIRNRVIKIAILMFGISLSDEVHEYMFFVSLRGCIAVGMDFLQQPSHIRGKGSHGLHTFGVEFHFALTGSVGDIPVLGGHYGHVHHLEHHVHGLEGGCCTTTTTNGYGGCRFVLYEVSCRVEQSLHQREDATVWLAVIDGRAYDECISRRHLLRDYGTHIAIEHASLGTILMTTTAIDTHADGLAANLDDLCLQSVFLKLLFNLLQATECVAVSSGASIDQQHFGCLTIRL